MKRGSAIHILRWISILLVLAAIGLGTLGLNGYRQKQFVFPTGSEIALVPVGGLNHQQASDRILFAYSQPIEVHYGQAVFQILPSQVGFQLDIEGMLETADRLQTHPASWQGYWDYLWEKPIPAISVPLAATVDEAHVRTYLMDEIETRYDLSPAPPFPLAGTPTYQPGQPGTTLDIDQAVSLISAAIRSLRQRTVSLTYHQTAIPTPDMNNLQVVMQQIIQLSQFQGLVEVYLTDLQTSQNIHFAYQFGAKTPPALNIAFSGWSTIKIPIMVSAFKRLNEPTPAGALNLLTSMIELSDNTAADSLAQTVIDKNLAPLMVTDDMLTLGLKNTFWGGFFYPSAPLLKVFTTPSNSRKDITTGPDPYDQTTPADLGMLLEDIYQCAQNGGGALPAAFGSDISQAECNQMIDLLSNNDIPQLIQAGLPFGTRWAHKHGWADEYPDGLIHTMGDAGIAFSPGGNFVMVVFVHDAVQVVFDPVNALVAHLGTAAYNYFNPPNP